MNRPSSFPRVIKLSGLTRALSDVRASVNRIVSRLVTSIWETWLLFSRDPLFRFAIGMMVSIAILGAIVVTFLEKSAHDSIIKSISDAIWWAFVTMTTTGYGDLYPKTQFGRFIAVLMMFAGIALTSLFTATVASIFVARRIKEARGLERIRMQEHTIICGWNAGAERVITGLMRAGKKRIVLVNELDEERMTEALFKYRDADIKFVRGNYCHEAVLERANVRAAEAAIVLADIVSGTTANADERTILATLAIKSIEPGVVTCAELLNRDNEQHLQRADVDDVIVSGEDSGLLLASAVVARGVPQVVRELLSLDVGNSLHRTEIPKQFVGRMFRELSDYYRTKHHAILIALASEDTGIAVDDILGRDNSAIDEFIRQKFSESEKDVFSNSQHQKINTLINPDDEHQIQPNDKAIVIARGPIVE